MYQEILDKIHRAALPFYVEADKNFVNITQHMNCAYNFSREISKGEKLNEQDSFILQASAILHDIGLSKCVLPKIVESEIYAELDNDKRKDLIGNAIEARYEHMIKGEKISEYLLEKILPEDFENRSSVIESIRMLVINHDIYKIVYLSMKFDFDDEKLDLLLSDNWLLQLLNEADALWMLTPIGIETDIQRTLLHNNKPLKKPNK